MAETLTIALDRPIGSAGLAEAAGPASAKVSVEARQTEPVEQQKKRIVQLCRALEEAVSKANELSERIFKSHAEQIAKLSVEIARKVLAQRVQEKDYRIESIIEEAIKSGPVHEGALVHLNPQDLAEYKKLQEEGHTSSLAGVEFAADPGIGHGECIVRTPKGIVESLIDQQLERIGEALGKAV